MAIIPPFNSAAPRILFGAVANNLPVLKIFVENRDPWISHVPGPVGLEGFIGI
jgi:hypothetical protein